MFTSALGIYLIQDLEFFRSISSFVDFIFKKIVIYLHLHIFKCFSVDGVCLLGAVGTSKQPSTEKHLKICRLSEIIFIYMRDWMSEYDLPNYIRGGVLFLKKNKKDAGLLRCKLENC